MDRKSLNQQWLDELKSRNDIVSVISQYIKLDRKGRNYWGCCPFHSEKTPSFCINDMEQFYHCFGCKESGDVIRFIEKIENCDFISALQILAQRSGMELPEMTGNDDLSKRKKEKERIMQLLSDAKNHYKENLLLPSSTKVQNYVKSRKITGKELKNFELGYSKDWTEIITYLSSIGYTKQEMKNAGIIEITEKSSYDVYADRLLFPIYNSFSEVIGFSARALEKTDYAKYKNTAKTVVFDKSNVLFGIQNIRRLKQQNNLSEIILVEGQMDVIAMFRAGFENTVATLGTALTVQHAKLLKRYVDKVVVCYDGDNAGIKAALRSIDILKEADLEIEVVNLPNGLDPDEYINKYGSQALRDLIGQATQGIDYKINHCAEGKDLNKTNEKSKFISEALKIISELANESDKQLYLEMVNKMSNVPIDILRRDLDRPINTEKKQELITENTTDDGMSKAIKYILASRLYKKEYANSDFDLLPYLKNNSYIKLNEYLCECAKNRAEPKVATIFDIFSIENEPNINDIINYNFANNDSKEYFEDCKQLLQDSLLEERQKKLNEEFNATTDATRRKELVKELYEITLQMKNKK